MQYKWTALTVTTVGTLMSGIDSRILIVGLPTVGQQLHTGPEELIWITQSFLLASTVCLLFIGRLADLIGRVKLYNYGFLIFTVGSALSALSLNGDFLIAFRSLQGLGSGLIMANSAAIVTDASPPSELGTMLGINQSALRAGSMAGLTLSGLILSVLDWRALFYVNIPVGVFGTIWAHRRLREISVRDPSRKVDWAGFILFSTGLTLILLCITFLSYGAGDALDGVSLLLAGSALVAVFAVLESKTANPLLDLRLFRIRLFAASNVAQLLNSIVWSGTLILVSFYLQIGLGEGPFQAGINILPLEVSYVLFSLLGSRLSDTYGTRLLCTLGLSMFSASLFFVSTFGASTGYYEIAFALVLIGIGNGLFTAPNLSAIMGSVPHGRRGIAAGFRQTMFNSGYTCGLGLVILFITLAIPYGSLAPLLQNASSSQVITNLARVEFLHGVQIAALLFAIIEVVAVFPSAMRGRVYSESATVRVGLDSST